MQTIQITLSDSPLEQAVLRLAEQQHQNLPELVIAALSYYVKEAEKTTTLHIKKLNPFQYAKVPIEAFQKPDKAEDLVFSDIEDSAAFAKKLRQQAWQRHE